MPRCGLGHNVGLELFLALDVVEEAAEAEPLDLSALMRGSPVGEQSEADFRLPELLKRCDRSRNQLPSFFPDDGDALGHRENAEDLHRALPGSKLVYIEQAGHFVIAEQGEWFAAEVCLWLEESGL